MENLLLPLAASTLYLVATPIGYLEDIVLRVLRVVRECNAVTRTGKNVAADFTQQRQSLISLPVSTDLCAASRISTTVTFTPSEARPAGLISLRTTAAK